MRAKRCKTFLCKQVLSLSHRMRQYKGVAVLNFNNVFNIGFHMKKRFLLPLIITSLSLFSLEHTSLLQECEINNAKKLFTQEHYWKSHAVPLTSQLMAKNKRFTDKLQNPELLADFKKQKEELIPYAQKIYRELKNREVKFKRFSNALIVVDVLMSMAGGGLFIEAFMGQSEDGLDKILQECTSIAAVITSNLALCPVIYESRQKSTLFKNTRQALQAFAYQAAFDVEATQENV